MEGTPSLSMRCFSWQRRNVLFNAFFEIGRATSINRFISMTIRLVNTIPTPHVKPPSTGSDEEKVVTTLFGSISTFRRWFAIPLLIAREPGSTDKQIRVGEDHSVFYFPKDYVK